MRLKDKIIIVTGSTTGIGKAIAMRCVEEGAKVLINGLDQHEGESVLAMLGEENAELFTADISTSGIPQRLMQAAFERFGRIDGLVNNAAMIVSSNIHTTDLDFLRKVLETNTIAAFALIQAAMPFLAKSRGSVLNIGSVNAYSGEPNLLPYSISKGALMTMTRNLGDTLFREEGIRINQINPGWVLTESETLRKQQQGLADDWFTALPDVYAPSGRLFKPAEIAAAAIYWLSDESGPVSGQVVDIEQYPFIGRNPPKDGSWAGRKL